MAKAKINSEKTLNAVKNQFTNLFMDRSRMAALMAAAHVSVSGGNDKIGNCGNVSTAPYVTCGGCCDECKKYCYAVRSYNRMGNDSDGKDNLINNPWFINTAILFMDRDRFFTEIETAIKANYYQFFRWHVSGEIVDSDYFARMVAIAEHCPGTRFLAFTKKYSAVNDFIAAGGTVPANFKIIFSAAPELEMKNPHNLPEAHVNFADESLNTCNKPAAMRYHCPGNCAKCRFCGAGCWFLENGAAVMFDQH